MHVCGSHEQAIAKFGLRAAFPRDLNVIMGPGCPVCITDLPEIDEAVALARQGVRIATYGDMVRVPGTAGSLADAQARRRRASTSSTAWRRRSSSRAHTTDEVVFFATGFETTAVATAAVILAGLAAELLGAVRAQIHPAGDGNRRRDAGHARRGISRGGPRGHDHRLGHLRAVRPRATHLPVVVAGFEPLDILAALLRLVELVRDGRRERRQHVSALRHARRQPQRAAAALARVPADRRALARHRARAERQPAAARRMGARSTRGAASRSTSRRSGSRRRPRWCVSASAETSWPASRRRPTARCSAARACRTRRSAPAW